MKASELKVQLARSAERVAEYLLPNGKRKGHEWKAGSTNGDEGDSLSVRLNGEKAGVWRDFAGEEGGDLLNLWMACRGCDLTEAMRQAKDFLGIREIEAKPPERSYRRPEKPQCKTPKNRVFEWLSDRGLTAETLKAFKVGEQERGGKVYAVFPYLDEHGELLNVKYRNPDDKRDMRQEKDAAPCLFGWHLIDPKTREITIAEGEIDAMTLHQCGVPALSINQGAGNHQWLETDWEKLERFEVIRICYDHDEAGDKGAAEVIKRLGEERCRRVRLGNGAKDANEWLLKGAEPVDFQSAVENARSIDPEELRSAGDYTAEVLPDLRTVSIWLLLALAVAGWGVGCAERTRAAALASQLKDARTERDGARAARDTLAGQVEAQKAEARAKLAALNASVLAQQKRIDAAHAAQEKTDATNLATIADLRDRLRRERLQRSAEDARRGSGGGGAASPAAFGADDRAAGGAEAGGLLPAAIDREADEEADAFDADQLNEAYRSCRASVDGLRKSKTQ